MEAKALREIRDEEWHGAQMLIVAQSLHRRHLCKHSEVNSHDFGKAK